MAHIVPAAIGDRDGEVAELQGRTGDITLPHACPPDGLAVPAVLIASVQIVSACQQSALLSGDVDMHRPAKAHRLHITAPGGDGLVFRLIHKAVVDHRSEVDDEPGVATLRQGVSQVEGRAVLVAAHLDVAVGDAVVALHLGVGGDDAFRQECESLRRLEGGSRCHRLTDGLAHVVTLRGIGGQTDDLTVLGIDGHDAAGLAFQQTLAQLLEHRTDSQRSVRGKSLCPDSHARQQGC